MASKSNDLSSQKKKSQTFPSEPRHSKTISSELKKTTTLSHGGVKSQDATQSKGSETIEETSFTMCSICLDPIVDASDDHDGQDSIYCEGLCDGWIHRRCAGLSVRAFNQLLVDPNKKSTSFHCPHCRLLQLSNEVVELKETVSKISSTLENLQQCCTPLPIIPGSSVVPHKSDIVTSPYDVDHSPSSASLNPPKTSSLTIHRPTPKSSIKLFNSSDRKFNVVVFGVSECVSGTSRKQRWISDLNNISDLFSQSAASIPKSSITDCHRLGKYSSSSTRPRPILVNFSSCNVVMEILSSRASFAPYFVHEA